MLKANVRKGNVSCSECIKRLYHGMTTICTDIYLPN